MKNILIKLHQLKEYGWELTQEAPSTSNTWGKQDLFAINHLLEHGCISLQMGDCIWEIAK